MVSITASRVIDASDRSEYSFCSEWHEDRIKFLIINSENNVYTGEVIV